MSKTNAKSKSKLKGKAVYVVDGARTPFLKAKGVGAFSASDLAVSAGEGLLMRQPFSPSDLDHVIIGSAMPSPDEANIARVIALRLGCGHQVPAFTVMRNCASGMQAIDNAALQIASGQSDLVLAGGTDAMSRAPILFNAKMATWFGQWSMTRTMSERFALLPKLRPSFLTPVIALLRGLTDPIVGLNMGQTAEKLAYKFNITREQMDAFAADSHANLLNAYANDEMSEVIPMIDKKGKVHEKDDGARTDSTPEKLGRLRPFFDKKYGMVTAGNSSQITDGACLLLLASADAVKQHNLPVIGRIVDSEWAALDPAEMGLGPVHAVAPICTRQGITPADMDTFEINEAFAAQVLACVAAFDDEAYSKDVLGLSQPLGAPLRERLNPDGGAIAAGHPIGARGARIVLHALHALEKRGGTRGMASICIGGGQGGAMYIERTTEVNDNA